MALYKLFFPANDADDRPVVGQSVTPVGDVPPPVVIIILIERNFLWMPNRQKFNIP
jgi:hypothetical protein